MSEYLATEFPGSNEGGLSKLKAHLVSEASLAKAARRMKLGRLLRLGKGEELSKGRVKHSLLADALEALIAAVYLDGGLEASRAFTLRVLEEELLAARAERARAGMDDYKTQRQELCQKRFDSLPQYATVRESGPDHVKVFEVELTILGVMRGIGCGHSKKEAEQMAEDKQEGERVVAAAFAEMDRLIALFDHRQPDTPLARLNQTGQLTQAPPELTALIAQAIEYGRLTAGAFDISIKPLLDARKAGATDWEKARQRVDYRQVKITGSEIHFEVPGMGLTLDGIAKGRVVDGATALLRTNGFANILVEAGGDLVGYGFNADDQPWQVGIAHPRQGGILSVLPVQAQAVATSGDYMDSTRGGSTPPSCTQTTEHDQ